jgi:hypothetical protein
MSVELVKHDGSAASVERKPSYTVTRKPLAVLPSTHQVKVESVWWLKQLSLWLMMLPVTILKEVKPTTVGFGRVAVAWANFVHQPERAAAAKQAEKNEHSKAHERLARSRRARLIGSLVALLVMVGGFWYLVATQHWLTWVGAALVIVAIFDGIGHIGEEKEKPPPPPLPQILTENVPLSQITKAILQAFEREGFPEGSVGVAEPLRWDPARMEYTIGISAADLIKPEHLRAIERAIGADDYSIRNLATGSATVRKLQIKVGDPLATTPEPPFLPSRSRSVTDYLDLGISVGDVDFALKFAALHVAVVGKTGSGKTEGMLRNIIDRLSACRDVVLWGIDLQGGPEFPLWRGVIRKYAKTPEQASQLLDSAQAEIDRRMEELERLAYSDEEGTKSKWHAGMGPHLIIIIDEFAVFSPWNGKGQYEDFNLMAQLERVIRTGRKVWVTLILATQKTGNADFGSTVISSQIGIKILMACEETDTVRMLSVEQRDAGWSPHLFAPAEDDNPRDAGKCYLESPRHRTPDIYRTYMAMDPDEVKRRARIREADGLPELTGKVKQSQVIDMVEVPEVLAAVESVFAEAGNPEKMPTRDILAALSENGLELSADELADELRPYGLRPLDKRWRPTPMENAVKGYGLADVQKAIRDLS